MELLTKLGEPNFPRIKIIIFDIDGTLLNTDELYFQLLKSELKKYNISLTEAQYGTFGLDDAVFHVGLDSSAVQKVRDRVLRSYYNDQIVKKLRFKKGAYKIIHELSKSYQLAIGSGERMDQIKRYLNHKNLWEYFKFIGHGGLVLGRKSNPQYFYTIARFFKAKPEECLMVGDSIYDTSALEAGCRVIIIQSKFTKYCTFNNKCLILDDLEELRKILKR